MSDFPFEMYPVDTEGIRVSEDGYYTCIDCVAVVQRKVQ